MFAKVSAVSFGIFFLGFTHSAIACIVAPPKDQPKLKDILKTDQPVFIGTVVDSGGPTEKIMVGSPPREVTLRVRPYQHGMAKIEVEIPMRGEPGKIFEVANGGMGDCSEAFEVGQRWFISGGFSGSRYRGGTTMLVDEFGDERLGDPFGIAHEEIIEMFPEVLKLPPPSIVVQEYVKENSGRPN